MTRPIKPSLLLATAMLLAACGSIPEQQHEGVEAVNEAMTHGMRAYRDDRYLEARQLFAKGLAHYRSMDDPDGALVAYINLVDVAILTGDFDSARQWLDSATRLAAMEDSGNLQDRLDLQAAQLAWLTRKAGSRVNDNATQTLERFINATDGDPDLALAALFLRTRIAFGQHDDDAAQWLGLLRQQVAANPQALSSARLARLEAQQAIVRGELDTARRYLLDAQRVYREERYRPGLAATHEELAGLEERHDNTEAAVFHAEQALFIRLWITDRHHSMLLLQQLAELESKLGNDERAQRYLALAEFARQESELKWKTMRQRLRGGKID